MATELIETLPKNGKGTVHRQRVRCGKQRCRCRHGEPHLAFYLFWREGGKLRKRHIPRSDVDAVRAACAARRERERRERQELQAWRRQYSALVAQLREVERHD
jgi:hypothetical protein